MKKFHTFKEDLKKSLSPLKDFGKKFKGEAEKFANSKEASDLKNNAMNFLIKKGYEVLDKGKNKLDKFEKKVNK